MTRVKKVFYYDKEQGLAMDGGGMTMSSRLDLDEFMEDLNEEIGSVTGYYLGEDYSFYINPGYDYSFGVDSSDSDVVDDVTEYINSKYEINFEPKAS